MVVYSRRPPPGATFTIPYPPGFPVLVPGQLVSAAVIDFIQKLDVKEIHGYDAEQGLRVFRAALLHKGILCGVWTEARVCPFAYIQPSNCNSECSLFPYQVQRLTWSKGDPLLVLGDILCLQTTPLVSGNIFLMESGGFIGMLNNLTHT